MEAMFLFSLAVIGFLSWPETYAPVLLHRRAVKLRQSKSSEQYWHPHETMGFDVHAIVTKHLQRPIRMLLTEPIVLCLALYASFAYGLAYLFLEAIPYVFITERGWGPIVGNLSFFGIFLGSICSIPINAANSPRYACKMADHGEKPVPEARLPPMMVGAFFFVIGLFWFAWTAAPSIPWPVPVIGSGFIGAAFGIIFIQSINYLVDAYGAVSASAVSANTVLRSLLAAALPLGARPLLRNSGVGPGLSILGGVAALALPVPFVLMKYGVRFRHNSSMAVKVEGVA